MRRRAVGVLPALCVAAACRGTPTAPPLGEALVLVDTDAPVPLLVSRLRVDAYTTDGVWYASDDFGLADPASWPTSFGVYSPVPGEARTVVLRLRAYADGNTRDYRGESFFARPTGADPSTMTPVPAPPPDQGPRLRSATGLDVTPLSEPQPLLAIDRLVLVTVPTDAVESLRVTLRGACLGTMADLAGRETCVDTEAVRQPLAVSPLDPDLSRPVVTQSGTFGVAPCTATPRPPSALSDGTPLFDEEVCVPGGSFVLGTEILIDVGIGTAVPRRVAVVPPFRMDRYEVTVGRWRHALERGFQPPARTPMMPLRNDAPLPANPTADQVFSLAFCTYSTAPVGRETFAVTCLDWETARAFCRFEGGDLPTEAEWEYAATMAGRLAKTAYAWGGPDDALPTCAQAVFGRGFDGMNSSYQTGQCTSGAAGAGFGPLPEGAAVYTTDHAPPGVVGDGDVSVGLGIANLGAGMSEWVRDTAYSFGSNCWMSQPLTAPACDDAAGATKSVRGTAWDEPEEYVFAAYRFNAAHDEITTTSGLRCVRPGT